MPAIVRTDSAEAQRFRVAPLSARIGQLISADKPRHAADEEPKPAPKIDPDRAPKQGESEAAKGETREDEAQRA